MHNGRMRDHNAIVKAIGPEQLAELTGSPIYTVRSWQTRNSIPAKHWALLVERGLATADELMAGVRAA